MADFKSNKEAGFNIYMANPDAGFDVPRPEKSIVFPTNDPNIVG